MRIALLADIHANREALEALLAAIDRQGVDRIALLGDLVGYGPDPEFVVDAAARLIEAGAIAVKGNHDEAVGLERADLSGTARLAMAWTRQRLSAADVAFLNALPMSVTDEDRLFVHASARQPGKWHYLNSISAAADCLAATSARRIFCGHTHRPVHFHAIGNFLPTAFKPLPGKPVPLSDLRRSVTVVGAAGQPRDGSPAACYGLLDTTQKTVTMHHVPYDAEATCAKIRRYGLPQSLGERLLVGA